MTDWFVATNGFSTNTGTIDSPFDIYTGMSGVFAQPGDTIYFRSGTYRYPNRVYGVAGFQPRASGTPSQPITYRPYNMERVIFDGGISTAVYPAYNCNLQGFEILVSEFVADSGNRWSALGGSGPLDIPYPWGGVDLNRGSGLNVINCIIHDSFQGIGHWGNVTGKIYGNIVYNNGWYSTDRNHGHGMYTQNATSGLKVVSNNMFIDNFSLSFQAYGSSTADTSDYTITNCSYLKTPEGPSDDGHFLFGGANPFNNVTITKLIGSNSVSIGFEAMADPGDRISMSGCRIWDDLGFIANFQNLTKFNNIWQAIGFSLPRTEATNGDRTGTPITMPTEPFINFVPNEYDNKLAYIHIMNYPLGSGAPANVTPSGFLDIGEKYALLNPTNMFGQPVMRGTYSGGTILVPTSGQVTQYVMSKYLQDTSSSSSIKHILGGVI